MWNMKMEVGSNNQKCGCLKNRQKSEKTHTHTGHLCLYPGTERKVAISPVPVFVPSTPTAAGSKENASCRRQPYKGQHSSALERVEKIYTIFLGSRAYFFSFLALPTMCLSEG